MSALVYLSIECPFDRTGPLHIFLQCTKSICVDIGKHSGLAETSGKLAGEERQVLQHSQPQCGRA